MLTQDFNLLLYSDVDDSDGHIHLQLFNTPNSKRFELLLGLLPKDEISYLQSSYQTIWYSNEYYKLWWLNYLTDWKSGTPQRITPTLEMLKFLHCRCQDLNLVFVINSAAPKLIELRSREQEFFRSSFNRIWTLNNVM